MCGWERGAYWRGIGSIEISPGIPWLAITLSKGTVRAILVLVVQLPLITCNGKIRQESDARKRFRCKTESAEGWGNRKIAPSAKTNERGIGRSYANQYEVLVHLHLNALLVVHEEKQHPPFFRRVAEPLNDNEWVTVAVTTLHCIATVWEKCLQWSGTVMLKQQKIIKKKAAKGLLRHTAETICVWKTTSFNIWPASDRPSPGRI